MSLALTNRIPILKDRAVQFQKCRQFFAEKNIFEVDVPLLTKKAPIDVHIDLVHACCMKQKAYLQSSPEYGMKRLLAEGIGDIYQLSHVYRDGEEGTRHNPEFTMVEWYRVGMPFSNMIEETKKFLQLFIDVQDYEILSFAEAFKKYAHIEIKEVSEDIDVLFATHVEPFLGHNQFTILIDFPKEMAALSQIIEKNGSFFAERFEFFYQGFEIANGYHELIDPQEQKKRLSLANAERKKLGKEEYPVDTYFLEALEKGLEDMCGVACGFDRLMMLRHGVSHINEVIAFPWNQT